MCRLWNPAGDFLPMQITQLFQRAIWKRKRTGLSNAWIRCQRSRGGTNVSRSDDSKDFGGADIDHPSRSADGTSATRPAERTSRDQLADLSEGDLAQIAATNRVESLEGYPTINDFALHMAPDVASMLWENIRMHLNMCESVHSFRQHTVPAADGMIHSDGGL